MCVRAVVCRVVPFDVPSMMPERREKSRQHGAIPRARLSGQCPDPAPRNRAERDFEAARPVDSSGWWILLDPPFEQLHRAIREPLVLGEKVALCQPDDERVPVQLPEKLDIATIDAAHVTHAVPMPAVGRRSGDGMNGPCVSCIDPHLLAKKGPVPLERR